MKAIQIISQDLFDKVRSRFENLEMGDEAGAVTIDPAKARFFDFDFVKEGVNLGRVSISLGDLGSLKIYYSQGITEGQDNIAKRLWYDFLKEMRLFAMRRLLRFDTRDIAKTNLDKNDFQHLAATQGPKEETMNMTESRWNHKSSKKTSRAVRGATEVIVRHHKAVDETYPGARSQRKNIKSIFIQNREGERFKYPFIHIAGAMAMGQHIDHGGVPHDPAGKAIMRMSEQIAQLQEFQRQVQHSQLHDDALGITERAVGRLHELKSQIEALSKRHYYESWISEFNEQEQPLMAELDPVTMEDYKAKFTQSSFNEHLASLFPLIHSIMQETNTVDLEEFVKESFGSNVEMELQQLVKAPDVFDAIYDALSRGDELGKYLQDMYNEIATNQRLHPDDDFEDIISSMADQLEQEYGNLNQKYEEFSQFESWADAVAENDIPDDQKENLKAELDNLKATGQKLELDNAYQFFNQFGIDNDDLEEKFEAAAREFPDMDALEVFAAWAMEEGKTDLLDYLGLTPEEQPAEPAAAPAPEQPVAEAKGADAMIQEVAKIVKSFYNRDNPNVGPFRGEEGIAIDVEKKISEKFGEKAGQQARMMAEKYMQKLTQEWSVRHKGDQLMGEKGVAEGEFRSKSIEEFKPNSDDLDNLKSKYLPDWEMLDHRILQTMYVAKDHRHALEFVEFINRLSEKMDHFAEVTQDVAEVTVKTSTFDVKGLTLLDFQLAIVIDKYAEKNEIEQVRMSGNFGMHENFADGKNPGRKGLSQRVGIPKNATIAQLEKHAKAPGEEEMNRIRKKHDRYDEDMNLIRKLAGMAK